MYFQIRTVTPDDAAELLRHNRGNRAIRPARVSRYLRAIERGEWELTHQSIALTADGRLIDGQHRLIAIVNSGVAVQMAIAYDVPASAFRVTDTGATRSARDIGVQAGYSADAAAAGRIVLAYDLAPHLVWSSGTAYGTATAAQILDYLAEIGDVELINSLCGEARRAASEMGQTGARSAFAALALLTTAHTPTEHEEHMPAFWEGLATGVGLGETDPRLLLRNFELKRRARPPAQDHLRVVIEAWNAHVQGRPLRQLRMLASNIMTAQGTRTTRRMPQLAGTEYRGTLIGDL